MINNKRILILTTIHQKNFNNFLKKVLLSFKKYKLDLKYIIKHNERKKKFTILRSPHVNKNARDQIELKHFKYYFSLKKK
jgi:ribosomal protein S10